MGKSCLLPPELSGLRIPGLLFSSLRLYAVEGFQLFFLETNQQLKCSSSVNQPNFFLILSHYFLIILPCSSLNKSSLLLVFAPSRYFSLLHRSGRALSPLPSPLLCLPPPLLCAAGAVPSLPGTSPRRLEPRGPRSPPCSAPLLVPASSTPTAGCPAALPAFCSQSSSLCPPRLPGDPRKVALLAAASPWFPPVPVAVPS